MMDGTAVTALAESFAQPITMEVDGKEVLVLPEGWKQERTAQAAPEAILLSTLMGLHDYLESNIDGLDKEKLQLRVVGPTQVELEGLLEDEKERFRRRRFARAVFTPTDFKFGQFLDSETFTIGLQVAFVKTVERDDLLTFVGSIRESSVRETVDDGLSQEVKTANGLTRVENARVPNPVTLAPYRTFTELDQPESQFVLRMRQGPENGKPMIALFEADGGAWKREAVARAAVWLRGNIEGVAVVA